MGIFLFFGLSMGLISSVVCFYYWLLAFVSICTPLKKRRQRKQKPNLALIAIIIPAHNEEEVISKTLHSCGDLYYPKEKYDVYVVADNCNDSTAEIARRYGAIVFERYDDINKGKGYALAFAFQKLLSRKYDVFFVLDADCHVDPKAMEVISGYVSRGHKILQINNTVSNPDDSVMTYALAVGNFIENDFFYEPKSMLGLAVFLRGTGMVIHRDILLKHPWDAHSIVEDMEYSLILLRSGHKIRFVPEVKVKSPFPVKQDQLRVQRTRWASGNLSFGRKSALKLIFEGVKKRRWNLADAGLTFLVLSRPLVLLVLFITVFSSFLGYLHEPSQFSRFIFLWSLVLAGSYVAYFSFGVIKFGLTRRRFFLLIGVPEIIFWLMIISLKGVLGLKKNVWERTPR